MSLMIFIALAVCDARIDAAVSDAVERLTALIDSEVRRIVNSMVPTTGPDTLTEVCCYLL